MRRRKLLTIVFVAAATCGAHGPAFADEFQDWLREARKHELDGYARELHRILGAWIKRGDAELGSANLSVQILRRAQDLITTAIADDSSSAKRDGINEALDKLALMAEMARLRAFLATVTSPPSSQAKSLAKFLLSAVKEGLLSQAEKSSIEASIDSATKSFTTANNRARRAEGKIFRR